MKAMAVFLEKFMLIHTQKIFPYNFKMYSWIFFWEFICHSSRTTWLERSGAGGGGGLLLGNGADDTATQSSDCKGNQGPTKIQRAVSNINSHFQGHGQSQVTSRPPILTKEWPLKTTRVHSHWSYAHDISLFLKQVSKEVGITGPRFWFMASRIDTLHFSSRDMDN